MQTKSSSKTALSKPPVSILTVIGFLLVALGWVMLVGGLVLGSLNLQLGAAVAVMAARADIVLLAQTAILTGFGLAIVGALRTGFGAFSRFFDAVLQRSSAPKVTPVVEPAPGPPTVTISAYDDDLDEPMPPPRRTPERRPTAERREPPTPPPPLRSRERNYTVLPDGSVEVETMFGTRIFATLDEARDFIR